MECVLIWNVFPYGMCSHIECVPIWNVFPYRMHSMFAAPLALLALQLLAASCCRMSSLTLECVPQVATFALLALQQLAGECIHVDGGGDGSGGFVDKAAGEGGGEGGGGGGGGGGGKLKGDTSDIDYRSFLFELASELGDESPGALGDREDLGGVVDENALLIRSLVKCIRHACIRHACTRHA